MDGQVNLNDIIDNVHKLLMRFIAEAAKLTTNTALQVAKLAMSQERSEAYHQFNLQLLDLVRRNLDFAQVNLRASLQTGSEKLWTLSLTDLLAQAPLNLELALGAELNLGHDSLVPYIVSIKPLLQGNLGIEVITS